MNKNLEEVRNLALDRRLTEIEVKLRRVDRVQFLLSVISAVALGVVLLLIGVCISLQLFGGN